jgi:hypothetical protein
MAIEGIRKGRERMQQRNVSYQQKVTVQPPPLDLADGKFEALGAAVRALLATGLFLVAGLCARIGLWAIPDYGPPSAAQGIGLVLCASIGGVALWFGVASVRLQMRAWSDYQGFLEEMRTAYAAAYTGADGREVVSTVRAEEINVRDIRDAITLVAYCYLSGSTTLSGMRGPLLVNDGRRLVRVGALSDYGAEQAGKALEDLGILTPGGRGRGRQLRDGSLEDLVLTVVRGWKNEGV